MPFIENIGIAHKYIFATDKTIFSNRIRNTNIEFLCKYINLRHDLCFEITSDDYVRFGHGRQ